jgi:probable addiction module antidote protein
MVRVTEFDLSAFLDDDEVVAAYLTAALEDDNPDVFLAAVGHVAKAGGMGATAERASLGRESLYKALAPGAKLRYGTVLKVLHSLGVKLTVSSARPDDAADSRVSSARGGNHSRRAIRYTSLPSACQLT